MSIKELENLVEVNKLHREPINASDLPEIEGLMSSGTRRLDDAKTEALSIESRFDLAYNAAHALALAALRLHGYRSTNRYLVFQALPHTLGIAKEKVRVLDSAHNKRNRSEYDGVFDVDSIMVRSLILVGADIEKAVRDVFSAKAKQFGFTPPFAR